MNNETTLRMMKWRSSQEQALFSSLWMAKDHATVLKGWKN
jgi:hypothetical protein